MKQQLLYIVSRLKRPKVLISIVSQIVTLLILFGFQVDENLILTATAIICSILAAMGVMTNPDTQTQGYGDDFLTCSKSGEVEPHVMVNGQMVCKNCGAVYQGEPIKLGE